MKFQLSEYKKLFINNITKHYENFNKTTLNEVNLKAKSLRRKQKINDRIKKQPLKTAYITVKDHKENFQHTLNVE